MRQRRKAREQKVEGQRDNRQEMSEEAKKGPGTPETEQPAGGKTGLWSRLRSKSGMIKGTRLKKDQLLIGLLTGVLLIVIAIPTEKEGKKQARQGENASQFENGEVQDGEGLKENENSQDQGKAQDAYTHEMEERLSQALSQVEGVGQVKVLITWKTSGEKVVEKDMPFSSQRVEEDDGSGGQRLTVEEERGAETIYQQGEDGSRTPYVVKEIKPLAEGVLVIAQGGADPATAQNILEAVQALFPLDSHKIKIMKMEGSK